MNTSTSRNAAVELAKQVLKEAGFLSPIWHIDDIIWREQDNAENQGREPREITAAGAMQILEDIYNTHDCNFGVNWDFIDETTDNYFRNKP